MNTSETFIISYQVFLDSLHSLPKDLFSSVTTVLETLAGRKHQPEDEIICFDLEGQVNVVLFAHNGTVSQVKVTFLPDSGQYKQSYIN